MLLFFVEKYTQQRITKEVLNTDKSLGYIILREKDNQVNVIWEERIDISPSIHQFGLDKVLCLRLTDAPSTQ